MPDDLPPDLLARMDELVTHYDTEDRGFGEKAAREILDLVAEWVGDSLVDRTFTRWERTEVGIDYCDAHTGLRNEDESACDVFVGCANCYGEGGLDTGDDSEPYVDCPLCGGSGVDPCDLVPLYSLTKREDT